MTPPFRTNPRHDSSGFTLVEVTIVTALLIFGLLALTSSTQALNALREADSEQKAAQNAIESVARSLIGTCNSLRDQTEPWVVEVMTQFGPNGAIQPEFDVDGLVPWAPDESVGTVRVITDETMTDDELGVVLGMPQDMDGDGFISSSDVSQTASLLAFVIEIRWRGPGGRRELVQGVYVSEY